MRLLGWYVTLWLTLLYSCSSQTKKKSPVEPFLKQTTLMVQPIGKTDPVMLDSVVATIKKSYPFKISVAKPIELPRNFKSLRGANRYRADSIIRYLKRMSINADLIVGITGYEISTSKYSNSKTKIIKSPEWKYKDWGIFGLGFCPGRSCVVSYCYLKQRNRKLLTSRLRKITIHEVGHTLGLPHCPDKQCVMTDACEKITTIDNNNGVLCKRCRKEIGF